MFSTEEVPPTYEPVLRFYAYFRETVTESNEEENRVRYVRICVYLEDHSIMIEERRMRNSGMEQGVLLRRMRAVNPKALPFGTQYVWTDFSVGISVEIYGVVYRIYACDPFTEDYLADAGRPVGAFEEPPDDLYSIKRKLTERPIRVSHQDTDKAHLRQFLDFDGKVLRFYAVWDDTMCLFGERRKFVLIYFLVDDTIEIRQVLPPNSGRDPVAQFLSKAKLTNPNTGRPYTDGDLQLGVIVDVYGREFLLYDTDEFTKHFVDQKHGPHDWTPIDIHWPGRIPRTDRILPPYNGWGDEEDSRGYCISLHPKPPRKDIVKYVRRDGQILRFLGTLKNPAPQDRFRKFIIAFYLADDTLAVFEVPFRNSGFAEGKFIQRARIKNELAGDRYFVASDFNVGSEVTINGFTFLLAKADEYSLSMMEGESDNFPQAELAEIVQNMRSNKKLVQRLRTQFLSRDQAGKGYLEPKLAEMLLIRIFGIQEHQAITAARRWTNDWGFDYLAFLAALA
jgi:hypothetical protein